MSAMAEGRLTRRQWLFAAAASTAWGRAMAQAARPIRVIVPFTPGGSTDILARALAPRLAAAMGTTVLVDNKPGAGGSLGALEASRAEPDGRTLLMGHIGTLAVNPSIYPKLGYDPLKSFAPVAWVARVPNVLVVNAQSGLTTLKDLIARAQARPGAMTYSSGGNGSAAHITFEYLKLRAKIFMLHIPYRGTAPSVTEAVSLGTSRSPYGMPLSAIRPTGSGAELPPHALATRTTAGISSITANQDR